MPGWRGRRANAISVAPHAAGPRQSPPPRARTASDPAATARSAHPGASTSRSSSSASTFGRSPYWPSDSAAHAAPWCRPRAKSPPRTPCSTPATMASPAPMRSRITTSRAGTRSTRSASRSHPIRPSPPIDMTTKRAPVTSANPRSTRSGSPGRDAQHGGGVGLAAEQRVEVADQRQRGGARLLGRPQPGTVVDVVAHGHAGLPSATCGLEDERPRVSGQRERDAAQVKAAGVEQVAPVDLVDREAGEARIAAVEPHLDRSGRHGVLDVVGREPALRPAHRGQVDAGDHVVALDAASERRVGQRAHPSGSPAQAREGVGDVPLGAGDVDVEAIGALETLAGGHAQPQLALTEGRQVEAGHRPPRGPAASTARPFAGYSFRLASIVP